MQLNKLSKKSVTSSEDLIFKNVIVICSIMSFIGCSFLFSFLNEQAVPTLPNIRVHEISWRIISSIHGLCAVLFVSLYLRKYISFITWYKLLSISIGFLIFDLARHFFFEPINFHAIIEPCIHHTVVLLVIVSYLYKYPRLSALGFLSELTTPILYTSWYLLKGGYTDTVYFKVSAVCLLIGFLLFRVCNFSRIYWELYKQKASTFELFGFGSIVLMNYFWFSLLLKQAFKTF